MNIFTGNSYLTQDQIYTNGAGQRALYTDPGHSITTIDYINDTPAPKPQAENAFKPITMVIKGKNVQLSSRDSMLLSIAKDRMRENADLHLSGKISITERYSGFEDGLKQWLSGSMQRFFKILRYRSVKKGLEEYDKKLLEDPKTLAYINYSIKPVYDSIVKPQVNGVDPKDFWKLRTVSRWCRNGENGRTFTNESGKLEETHHAVASSNDRTSPHVVSMRTVDDLATGESISYTGRADTKRKAQEQLQFIFESEMKRSLEQRKGLKKVAEGYELTFMVNNLLSSNSFFGTGLTFLKGLDERASTKRKLEAYMALAKEPITLKDANGKKFKVRIKPVYFNQGFNFLSRAGAPYLQSKINAEGNQTLFKMIDEAVKHDPSISEDDKELLLSAKRHLQKTDKLYPEEAFFYRDLVAKILHIPEITHCKSQIDRTTLGVAIATATQSWRNLGKEILANKPHAILSDPLFRDIFMANIHANHQATYVSHSSIGKVLGHEQLSHQRGFEWGGNNIRQNPVVRRMLPDRYLDKKRKKFNLDAPFFGERGLIKKKGMKMYYTEKHPLVEAQAEVFRTQYEAEREATIRFISKR